jgi:hypothetical protein
MTLNDIKQKLEYKLRVSKADHKKNLELSSSFFDELMEYFRYGLSDKLKPLDPEQIQVNILHYALDLHALGTLKNTENKGKVLRNKRPYLLRTYETNAGFEHNKKTDFALVPKRATFNLEWDVVNETPKSLNTGLFANYQSIGHLYFWFNKDKITSSNQLKPFYFNFKRAKEDITVYESGTRLIHSIDAQTPFGEGSLVFHFHLLGGFNSKTTKSMQFLYGCNELTDERYGFISPFKLIEKY